MPRKLKWAPFGPTCIKLYNYLKLGITRGIISEHAAALGTIKKRFLTRHAARGSITKLILWHSHCKREKVTLIISIDSPHPMPHDAAPFQDEKGHPHKWSASICVWGEGERILDGPSRERTSRHLRGYHIPTGETGISVPTNQNWSVIGGRGQPPAYRTPRMLKRLLHTGIDAVLSGVKKHFPTAQRRCRLSSC